MTMYEQIKKHMVEAMKAKDQTRLTTIRGLLSAFTNELVATGKTPQDIPSDDLVATVVKREAKRRKDAIEQYRVGGRDDLAASEVEELAVIETYMPRMASEDEIKAAIARKKQDLNVTDKAGIGKLIGAVMQDLKGQADGTLVKKLIEQEL